MIKFYLELYIIKEKKRAFANWLIINVTLYIYIINIKKTHPKNLAFTLLNIIKDKIQIEKYILYLKNLRNIGTLVQIP